MLRTIRRPSRVAPPFERSPAVRHRKYVTEGRRESTEQGQASPNESLARSTEKTEAGEQPIASSSSSLTVDIDKIKSRLRIWSIRNASALRARMDDFSSGAQHTFQQLGGRLNEVTGYHEIEMLKKLVAENERKMHEVREEAKAAKAAYEEAVARRSNSQRETNELLQRKSSWTDADVMRFTQLVRADHVHEQDEARAQERVTEAESATDRQFAELMRTILARYHEEQVWSDKIRSASTYGSLAALGLNLAVFVLAIVLVEPWKRKRLVQSFEMRVIELNEANQRVVEAGLEELRVHQEQQESVLAEIRAAQAALNEDEASAVSLREKDEIVEDETLSAAPDTEFERNAKAARDRQTIALSAAGAIGAGIVGYILGSWFK